MTHAAYLMGLRGLKEIVDRSFDIIPDLYQIVSSIFFPDVCIFFKTGSLRKRLSEDCGECFLLACLKVLPLGIQGGLVLAPLPHFVCQNPWCSSPRYETVWYLHVTYE